MHHRREWCYDAAMTPRAVKFGRIGGDRYARESACARLASGDGGRARCMRSADSLTSNAVMVLWPQYVASWGMAAGVPLPNFSENKTNNSARRCEPPTSLARSPRKGKGSDFPEVRRGTLPRCSIGPARREGGGWIPAKRVNVVGANGRVPDVGKPSDGDCLVPPPASNPRCYSLVALEREAHGRGQVAPL